MGRGLVAAVGILALSAWIGAAANARDADRYLPLVDAGGSPPLAIAEVAGGGNAFTGLPDTFDLTIENPYPITEVFSVNGSSGGSATKIRPDLYERFGLLAGGRTLRLHVTMTSPSSALSVPINISSVESISVNVLGEALLGTFSPVSIGDLNALIDASSEGPAELVREIRNQVIVPLLKHALSKTTAIARLATIMKSVGFERSWRKWFLQHLGKGMNPVDIAIAAGRSAQIIGAYWGLAGAGVPGDDTASVRLRTIVQSPPAPAGGAPVITGITGNVGTVGAPPFPVTLTYQSPTCSVTGGVWTDQFGIAHDFGSGRGSCSNGVGSMIPGYGVCTAPDGTPGRPGSSTNSIVLRDAQGRTSAPYTFQIVCQT